MSWSRNPMCGLKLLAFSALLLACEPKIGDDCSMSTDCSQTGSRTCDDTMPGGYCTIFNCESDECPSEAACIGFVSAVSTLPECSNPTESRELRTFCMRRCSSDDDCRSGYECLDLNAEGNDWGSVLVDKHRSSGKVCALVYSAMPTVDNESASAGYCEAGSYVDDGYYDAASGGQGSGGQGSGGQSSGGQSSGGQSSGGEAGAQGGSSGASSSSTAAAGSTQ